jgi:hypothetical protein
VNWYHPHYHSSTAQQVYGGMAGIVQIGRAIDTNLRAEYGRLPERILVLTGMSLAPSLEHPGMFEIGPTANGTSPTLTDPNPAAAAGGPSIAPRYAPTYFVNGQVNPIIAMRPGETQVWTVANFSPFAAYSLGIYRIGSAGRIAASAPLFRSTLLAQDGNDYVTPVTTLFTKQRDIMKDTFSLRRAAHVGHHGPGGAGRLLRRQCPRFGVHEPGAQPARDAVVPAAPARTFRRSSWPPCACRGRR